MMSPGLKSAFVQMRTLGFGLCGGLVAAAADIPLPWLIGSLLAVIGASFFHIPVRIVRPLRNCAMVTLLTGVGLTFTAAAARSALAQAPLILCAAFATLGIGLALSPVIARLARLDRVTAFFCTVPGGPAEMGMMAERLGVNPLPVTISQLLRIVSLVVFLPPIITATGIHGDLLASASVAAFDPSGFVLILALSFALAVVLTRAGFGSGFIVGPLLVGVGLSVAGLAPSSIPRAVLSGAQVVSGCYLGAQFTRQVMQKLRGFLPAAFASVFLLGLGCALVGIALSYLNDEAAATMVLATAPGSVTEMAITANVLGLDTPIVLAFHIARICIVMMLIQPCFRLMGRIGWIVPQPPTEKTA